MRPLVARRDTAVSTLMRRFGGSVAHVLTDPQCSRFTVPGIEGVIPYRKSLRCRVAIGDPVCDLDDADDLAERFRLACAADGSSTMYAAASEGFAERCVERGYAAIEYGEELFFDPRRDPLEGGRGRELRKKVHRAQRGGVTVQEHREGDGRYTGKHMREVARLWLAARQGPQAYITPLPLFEPCPGRRYFYALARGRMLGVVSLQRMDALDAWVFEHLIVLPDAPVGTSELLVTAVLKVMGREGVAHATFGPAPVASLRRIHGVGRYGSAIGRLAFGTASRLFHLSSLLRYREKFQVARREGSYLLFHPARIGVLEAVGLVRAFSGH